MQLELLVFPLWLTHFPLLKYAKVKAILMKMALLWIIKLREISRKYGNNDDRVDQIANDLVHTFMNFVNSNHTYRGGIATTSILTITSNVVYVVKTQEQHLTDVERVKRLLLVQTQCTEESTHGAVASLASVAKLPFKDAQDGISNTFSIVPGALGKEDKIFTGDL